MKENSTSNPILSVIKVGREEYEVKKGDYIVFNGACYQFTAGDLRCLKFSGFTSYNYIVLPKTLVKKIPFDKMVKEEYVSFGMNLVRWYF